MSLVIVLCLYRKTFQNGYSLPGCNFSPGEPIDERGPIKTDKFAPIHAEAPPFTEMSVEQEILVTGIKVVDLLAPYAKGGKIGMFGLFQLGFLVSFTSQTVQ